MLAWAAAGWAFSFFMVYYFIDIDTPVYFFGEEWVLQRQELSPLLSLCFTLLFPREQRRLSSTKLFLLMLPSSFF